MASAEYLPEKVKVVQEEGYFLRLSKEEAETLLFIFARIGGDPETTARKYTEDIKSALWKAGANSNDNLMTERENRAIYFTSDKEMTD